MSNRRYESTQMLNEPLSLTEQNLRDLDAIFEDLKSQLSEQLEQRLKARVAELDKEGFSRDRISSIIVAERHKKPDVRWTFDLPDNIKHDAESLKSVLDGLALKNDLVTGFTVELTDSSGDISVECRSPDNFLWIRTPSRPTSIGTEAAYRLRKWFESARLPYVERVWRTARLAIGPVAVLLSFAAIVFSELPRPSALETRTAPEVTQRAHEILKVGVNDKNRDMAIQLLMQRTFQPAPPLKAKAKAGLPIAVLLLMVVANAFGVLSSVGPPKLLIAIGRSKSRLVLWNRWMKFVLYGLPPTFLTIVVMPVVKDWVLHLFK